MNCCTFSQRSDLWRTALGAAALALAVFAPSAEAASPDDVYKAIVSEIISPGFATLDHTASEQAKSWAGLCSSGTAQAHAAVVASFHDTADAWAAVETFRMGPAAKDFRRDRFYLWPERKNAVARGLSAALETPTNTVMDDTWISQQSAAIQGLPVLERLLFDDGKPKDPPKPGTAECQFGVAVSRNAARIAHELSTEWTARTAPPNAADRTALATDIVSGVGLIKEEKYEAVIGKSEELAKPKAAEFWRSGRSLRNMAINAETYERVARIVAAALPEPGTMTYAAATVKQVIAGMHEPFAAYAAGKARSDGNFLLAALDSLGDSTSTDVSAALGVTVGFNSSDGD